MALKYVDQGLWNHQLRIRQCSSSPMHSPKAQKRYIPQGGEQHVIEQLQIYTLAMPLVQRDRLNILGGVLNMQLKNTSKSHPIARMQLSRAHGRSTVHPSLKEIFSVVGRFLRASIRHIDMCMFMWTCLHAHTYTQRSYLLELRVMGRRLFTPGTWLLSTVTSKGESSPEKGTPAQDPRLSYEQGHWKGTRRQVACVQNGRLPRGAETSEGVAHCLAGERGCCR